LNLQHKPTRHRQTGGSVKKHYIVGGIFARRALNSCSIPSHLQISRECVGDELSPGLHSPVEQRTSHGKEQRYQSLCMCVHALVFKRGAVLSHLVRLKCLSCDGKFHQLSYQSDLLSKSV